MCPPIYIGLDNGFAPKRRQAIIRTNADPIQWRIYAALGRDELSNPSGSSLHSYRLLKGPSYLFYFDIKGLLHQHSFPKIWTWINNYINCIMWDAITSHLFSDFNGWAIDGVRARMSNFISILHKDPITYPRKKSVADLPVFVNE